MKTSNRLRPTQRMMHLALTGTAAISIGGAAVAQQETSPLAGAAEDRHGYASDVVVNESFSFFPGGRPIERTPEADTFEQALAAPQTLTRDLGIALIPGLEIQPGSAARIFEDAPRRRGATTESAPGPGVAKIITSHALAYRGVPLAPGSDVVTIATATGEVLTVRERNIPRSVDGATPELARDAAIDVALSAPRTPAPPPGVTADSAELEVFVAAEAQGRLAWRVRIAAESLTEPWAREVWVAAIGEPVVLADREAIFHTHHGQVTATSWVASPFGGTTSGPVDAGMVNRNDGTRVVTNREGRYAFLAGTGTATLTTTVAGVYSRVDNVAGAELARSGTGTPAEPIDFALDAAGDLELAQTTALVWTTRARRLTQDFVPPSALEGLPTNVNIANSCNAFWNGSSINFFQAGGGCPNTAYVDVVLHEYGHGVDARLGGILNGGYSEGFGDALGLIGTRQPCLGRDFFGAGTCLRPAADVILWPPAAGEGVHAQGRRYAGFTWALITGLQAVYAPDDAFRVAQQLVMAAAKLNPADIPDAVRLSFLADDDDGDPSTCSPHFEFLAAAADSRNIPRPPNPLCAVIRVGGFAPDNGGWQVDKHPRFLADVDADGRNDIVGFGDDGVWVSLSTGAGFTAPGFWLQNLGVNQGWQVGKHPRFLADVNADRKADLVGFGDDWVFVATSTGAGFDPPVPWAAGFTVNSGGWQVDQHPRFLADINADDRADIVGFGDDGVWVSLSTGTGFTAPALWLLDFAPNNGGWQVDKHPRLLADVNADRRADIVGFGDDTVWVSTSTGFGFDTPAPWVGGFAINNGGWQIDKHPRLLADVNADRRADIVGFGDEAVWVSTSTGGGFSAPAPWVDGFALHNGGWQVQKHPRILADVNADDRADIVGFGDDGVWVSISSGGGFTAPGFWLANLGFNQAWRVEKHPRFVADVNADRKADLVGFGDIGVWVAAIP